MKKSRNDCMVNTGFCVLRQRNKNCCCIYLIKEGQVFWFLIILSFWQHDVAKWNVSIHFFTVKFIFTMYNLFVRKRYWWWWRMTSWPAYNWSVQIGKKHNWVLVAMENVRNSSYFATELLSLCPARPKDTPEMQTLIL